MVSILGLNAFHGDSAAALIIDGEIVAAAEEERFVRIKHWAGLPANAISYCLREGDVRLSDLDYIALNQDSSANLNRKLRYLFSGKSGLSQVAERLKNRRERSNVVSLLEQRLGGGFKGELIPVEHHMAHLSSAFHASPFKDASVVSVDGFGDFASGAWGSGSGTKISIDQRVYFPHSLGTFYQALTQYLGFPNYGDEYKVMGLAPYGNPSFMNEMHEIVQLGEQGAFELALAYFRHHNFRMSFEWEDGSPTFDDLFSEKLLDLLGPKRQPDEALSQKHKDIAHSVQAMYEEAFFHLLSHVHGTHGHDNLALAGGCAMNSVANGKIRLRSPFKNAYVQSAAGDAGGAIGAALSTWHDRYPDAPKGHGMPHAYLGPSFDDEAIKAVLDERLPGDGFRREYIEDEARLCRETADAIADGRVVGWFNGRMEWGPRALGNRSILCDPRRADMKEILNHKIKRRESFRPFAPSILRAHVAEWFEQDDDVPFMMKVFQVREEKRAKIPAVTHVDGSGRLQTVSEQWNPRYARLISAFHATTGVPMVLNTSFNENEPVVCQPSEALECFLRTKMDMLIMGNWIVERPKD